MQPMPPCSAPAFWLWVLGVATRHITCGFYLFIYLFIFPPSYVAVWDSKTPHRPTGESVSWCLETSPLLRLPPVAHMIKRLSIMRETQVWSLGWDDTLKKEMAIHSSTFSWKIPLTEEPGRLQSMGSVQRVRHNRVTSLVFFFVFFFLTFLGWISAPISFVSLFIFYILSYLL